MAVGLAAAGLAVGAAGAVAVDPMAVDDTVAGAGAKDSTAVVAVVAVDLARAAIPQTA